MNFIDDDWRQGIRESPDIGAAAVRIWQAVRVTRVNTRGGWLQLKVVVGGIDEKRIGQKVAFAGQSVCVGQRV